MSVIIETRENPRGLSVGVLTLSNPESLNSLSLEMIEGMRRQLEAWKSDSSIGAVLIDAAGEKAFCAGGDIVRLYQGMKANDGYPERFFEQEYRLDFLLHHYPKPVAIWGDGIVMGGGMGVFQGGTLRVATERTTMAMPEITIGLYPDVGATFFLRDCPGKTGFYLALTGTRVNGREAVWLKLADVLIQSSLKSAFYEQLFSFPWCGDLNQDSTKLRELGQEFAERSRALALENVIEQQEDFTEELGSCLSPQELWSKAQSFSSLSEWASRGLKNLSKGSPTSIGIIFEQFRRGASLSLKESFQMEWVVSVQCARHPDFREGVRALLIDKDQSPKWTPNSIAQLSSAWIAEHFELPEGISQNPLKDL